MLAKRALSDGSALKKLQEMVARQGGDSACIDDTNKFAKAQYVYAVKSEKAGYITRVDTEAYGLASLALGAGRNTAEDTIDYSAGIILQKKTGDYVEKGETLATLYSNDEKKFETAERILLAATSFGPTMPEKTPLIYDIVE